jgi:hypothetical protein
MIPKMPDFKVVTIFELSNIFQKIILRKFVEFHFIAWILLHCVILVSFDAF